MQSAKMSTSPHFDSGSPEDISVCQDARLIGKSLTKLYRNSIFAFNMNCIKACISATQPIAISKILPMCTFKSIPLILRDLFISEQNVQVYIPYVKPLTEKENTN